MPGLGEAIAMYYALVAGLRTALERCWPTSTPDPPGFVRCRSRLGLDFWRNSASLISGYFASPTLHKCISRLEVTFHRNHSFHIRFRDVNSFYVLFRNNVDPFGNNNFACGNTSVSFSASLNIIQSLWEILNLTNENTDKTYSMLCDNRTVILHHWNYWDVIGLCNIHYLARYLFFPPTFFPPFFFRKLASPSMSYARSSC